MSRKEFLISKVVAAFILRSQKAVLLITLSSFAHYSENSQESACSLFCPQADNGARVSEAAANILFL